MKLYRDFETVEALDREYLPSLRVPDLPAIRERWAKDNARLATTVRSRIAYGPTRDEYIDVFPGAVGGPIHIFLHGGYWRANAPSDFYFVAERLIQDGFIVALPNYALAPKASIDEIVRQVRASITWVHLNSDVFDGDATNVTISGHSAGGHLTAMALLTDWRGDYGIEPAFIRGGVAVSGLYDLAPFPYTTLQPSLQLTWDQVARNSPIRHSDPLAAPLTLTVGGDESDEFLRQMTDYAAHAKLKSFAVPGANHFTILDAYLDRASPLYRTILESAA